MWPAPILRRISTLLCIDPRAWLTARTVDDWGSHLPVLLGLSILLSPRSVVEFGSGRFSTALFTDKRYFPAVDRFRSIEDNPAWFARAQEATVLRPGDVMRLVDNTPQWIQESGERLDGLIFIDNGEALEDRTVAIRATFERAESDSVVVIHDFEIRAYRRAVPHSWPFVTVRAWRPMTGIACRDEVLLAGMRRLGDVIRRHRHVRPTDCEAWFEILQRLR